MTQLRTAEDYTANFMSMVDSMDRAKRDEEEVAAGELGITVEELRASRANAESREQAEQQQRVRFERMARLEPLESRLDPAGYRGLVSGQLKPTPPLQHVRAWLADTNAKPFLILAGEKGVGKTVALAYALLALDGEYMHVQDLAERVRPWRDELQRGVKPARLSMPLVVVDDVGTEDKTPRDIAALYAVVDARQGRVRWNGGRRQARTIITTNCGRDAFFGSDTEKAWVEPRTAARLAHSGKWCGCGNVNLRSGS